VGAEATAVAPFADAALVDCRAGLLLEIGTESSGAPIGFLSRVSKGVGALSLSAFVNILSQITVPIALYVWGKFRFGEWILLSGFIQFLKITDLGVQTYVVNRLCASFARGNRDEFRRVLHSTLRVQLPLSLAVLGAVAVAAAVLPAGRVLGLHTIGGRALFAAILLLSAELLLGVPMGVIAGVYRATGHLARAAILGAARDFAVLAVTVLLIATNRSFVSVAAGQVTVAVIVTGLILSDLHRCYPWLGVRPTHGSWREGLMMVGPGLFFLLIPLADYIANELTLIVTQRWLGGGEVSRLATHRMIINFGMMISSLLTNAVWPELTAMHALGNTHSLMRVHRTLAKLNLWIVGGSVLVLLPLISVLYPLWTARRLTLDSWTLGFLTARFLLWTVWSASSTVLCAGNRHYGPSIALVAEAVVTGVLAVFLVPTLGMRGAALAALLADIGVCAWLMPLLVMREFGENFVEFAWKSLRAGFAVLLPAALCLAVWNFSTSIVVRYALAFPACICLGVLIVITQLDEQERYLWGKLWTRTSAKSREQMVGGTAL
jgi:O-antigen/teichoic acid export membrane protein